VPRAGFEHATTRSSAERSPRLSYLGTLFHAFCPTSDILPRFSGSLIIYVSSEILTYLLRHPFKALLYASCGFLLHNFKKKGMVTSHKAVGSKLTFFE
jgi:hypothetical protein